MNISIFIIDFLILREPKPIFRFRIPQQRKTEGINGFEKLKSIKEE